LHYNSWLCYDLYGLADDITIFIFPSITNHSYGSVTFDETFISIGSNYRTNANDSIRVFDASGSLFIEPVRQSSSGKRSSGSNRITVNLNINSNAILSGHVYSGIISDLSFETRHSVDYDYISGRQTTLFNTAFHSLMLVDAYAVSGIVSSHAREWELSGGIGLWYMSRQRNRYYYSDAGFPVYASEIFQATDPVLHVRYRRNMNPKDFSVVILTCPMIMCGEEMIID
jgi:hypothetical protein